MVSLPLDEVSAKVRTGGPIDDEEDMELPVWAGVLPLRPAAGPARAGRRPADRRRPRRHTSASPTAGTAAVGPSLSPMGTYIGPGVWEIDTLPRRLVAADRRVPDRGSGPGAGRDRQPVLRPALLAALEEHGVAPGDLAGVAVTHIHLDHAGGVGDVARAFPQATVYVHEKGARHLVDPDRLVDSAARVYGDLLDSLYGRLDPTPAERIHVLADGETIAIGRGRTLTTVDSPGHAKHHLALHDSESGILFAGDAVGVRLPDAGVLRPATPPADFDLDQAVSSLRKFRARSPAGVALAHYGLIPDPLETLEEAEGILRALGRGGGEGLAGRRGHRRRPRAGVRPQLERCRSRPSGEAGDPQRHSFQRRRPASLAGDHQGRPACPPVSPHSHPQ